MLTLSFIEYERSRPERGRKLLWRLPDLPDDTPDLAETIDHAGDFLIDRKDYADGAQYYRRAARRFPRVLAFHQAFGCCASHLDLHDEAISAFRVALVLDPENQELVNNLGWALYLGGQTAEARPVLERAVAMDPDDERARNNLGVCTGELDLADLEAEEREDLSEA